MTTAPVSAYPATDPRHYTGELADYWEDRDDLADFAVATTLAAESVRAELLGHHRRAADLLAAAERGLPTADPATARGWATELWFLRGALLAGPDPSDDTTGGRRSAHLADTLIESFYALDPLVLEWHLHRHRTAPFWCRGRAGRDVRTYLLSVQYDPTDRYTFGVVATDRHARLGTSQQTRVVYVGKALGDPIGQWLLVDTDEDHLCRALHPRRTLAPAERDLLTRAQDLTPLEDAWAETIGELLGRWMTMMIQVGVE